MRHEHLVVTVDAETKSRIDDDLGAGESLESWVADAIEAKLDRRARDDDPDDLAFGRDGRPRRSNDDADDRRDLTDYGADERPSSTGPRDDGRTDRTGSGDERTDRTDDDSTSYGRGFEYVDDCGI